MATILPFTPKAAGASRRPAGASAAILLFTGVRYERLQADEPGSTGAQEGRGNRRPRRRSASQK